MNFLLGWMLKAGRVARFFSALFTSTTAPLFLAGCGSDKAADDPVEIITLERELSGRLHALIAETSVRETAPLADYTLDLPRKPELKIEMIAIPGGEFLMGSPVSEIGRNEDEGPQHPVRISPFWMGKFEVSWELYNAYIKDTQRAYGGRKKEHYDAFLQAADSELVDWVTGPSVAYMEMSFGMGMEGTPAICMTQLAASHFCQWLSAQTGHFYRLPTEAEWEYACRAGSTTTYHYGDDPWKLGEFDFHDPDQTHVAYRQIGKGKPNPWGLYDMHGNVLEWCLDGYDAEVYGSRLRTGEVTVDPRVKATRRYPRVARGGSWYDTPDYCRSASRTFSTPDWMMQDPSLPKSLWWHTDAIWLGFRIVRPHRIPQEAKMHEMWNSGDIHHQKKDPIPKPAP